jgi:hypothetical protein
MATVQHSAITDPNIHEPKGVAAATVNKVYVSNGTGSGTWKKLSPPQLSGITTNGQAGDVLTVNGSGDFVLSGTPHGQVDFYNLSTPYTLTYPSSFTKLAPTTTAGGIPSNFTESTNGRLTYTGTDTVPVFISYSVSLDQTSGADRDLVVAIYENGSISGGHSVITTTTGQKHTMVGITTITMATNDYVELYIQNTGGSGNIRLYAMQLNALFAGA